MTSMDILQNAFEDLHYNLKMNWPVFFTRFAINFSEASEQLI